jgi:hypothetical protein
VAPVDFIVEEALPPRCLSPFFRPSLAKTVAEKGTGTVAAGRFLKA